MREIELCALGRFGRGETEIHSDQTAIGVEYLRLGDAAQLSIILVSGLSTERQMSAS